MTQSLRTQLDDLFGEETSEESINESEFLGRLVESLRPIEPSRLWLVEDSGEILSHWEPALNGDDASKTWNLDAWAHPPRRWSSLPLIIAPDDKDGICFWVRLSNGRGITSPTLGGRIDRRQAKAIENSDQTLQERLLSWLTWLKLAGSLGLDATRLATSNTNLATRLKQVTTELSAFREEHRRVVAQTIQERDARLREKQAYLERLEREVAERTATLRQQSKELEANHARLRKDLESAARIQRGLLPTDEFPKAPTIRCFWKYVPCDELGGDSLNIFRLDERHVIFYVLDVSGHGVPAALLSVTLSRVLSNGADPSSLLKRRIDTPPYYEVSAPKEVTARLNQQFPMDDNQGQYFTMALGLLDTQTRQVRLVIAGHPGPIILPTRGEPRVLESSSFPIGWFDDMEVEETVLQFEPGDRLILYTDGLTEASNADGELFSPNRAVAALQRTRGEVLHENVQGLVAEVSRWAGGRNLSDDLSILAIEFE